MIFDVVFNTLTRYYTIHRDIIRPSNNDHDPKRLIILRGNARIDRRAIVARKCSIARISRSVRVMSESRSAFTVRLVARNRIRTLTVAHQSVKKRAGGSIGAVLLFVLLSIGRGKQSIGRGKQCHPYASSNKNFAKRARHS